ncbi:MAG: hypothetical protein IJB70_04540 [Clostridia bacterium]|nr:hypothetical protein [Clostridia bacterium]
MWEKEVMLKFYERVIPKPRTIDVLEIFDCLEIVCNDLARYGIEYDEIMRICDKYILPMKWETDKMILKQKEKAECKNTLINE